MILCLNYMKGNVVLFWGFLKSRACIYFQVGFEPEPCTTIPSWNVRCIKKSNRVHPSFFLNSWLEFLKEIWPKVEDICGFPRDFYLKDFYANLCNDKRLEKKQKTFVLKSGSIFSYQDLHILLVSLLHVLASRMKVAEKISKVAKVFYSKVSTNFERLLDSHLISTLDSSVVWL